ncbi:MAG: hypothetical protein ACI9C9_001811, partial [Marivirga sp.]
VPFDSKLFELSNYIFHSSRHKKAFLLERLIT